MTMVAGRVLLIIRESMEATRMIFVAGLLAASVVTVAAAEAVDMDPTNSTPNKILLLDALGRVVEVATNQLSQSLQPSAGVGLNNQIPDPVQGSSQPLAIQQRMQTSRAGQQGFQFFPAVPPRLMPYLASQDEYGNTAIRPGALFPFVPWEPWMQGGKYELSGIGFRYSLQQSFTFASLSNVKQGESTLSYYTFDLKSKLAVFDAPADGTAGWISSQIEAKNGLGSAGENQDAKSNLGTLTDPTSIWSKQNGFRVPELAWQQSARNGEIVLVSGMVSQQNYLDDNAYANSGRSKFMNSALVNSQVLPLAEYNFGFNLQWQPAEDWYVMLGGSAGNAPAGSVPWTDFTWNNWSLPMELGYAPRDFLGMGPGIYRVQPFVAGMDGTTGGGLGFDLQQKLGADTPFGWFGRFGFGDAKVSAGAAAQIGTGLVMQGPFKHLLLDRTSNDLLGMGFVWSQPADTTQPVYHENEYVWETVYTLQLSPTIKIQPDFQMIWDPAFHRDTSHATVFQLQLVIVW
jgi:porin